MEIFFLRKISDVNLIYKNRDVRTETLTYFRIVHGTEELLKKIHSQLQNVPITINKV